MTIRDAVSKSQAGVQIKIQVTPGSHQTCFPAGYNQWRQSIEIKVRAQATQGKANYEMIQTMAAFFKISPHDITIV